MVQNVSASDNLPLNSIGVRWNSNTTWNQFTQTHTGGQAFISGSNNIPADYNSAATASGVGIAYGVASPVVKGKIPLSASGAVRLNGTALASIAYPVGSMTDFSMFDNGITDPERSRVVSSVEGTDASGAWNRYWISATAPTQWNSGNGNGPVIFRGAANAVLRAKFLSVPNGETHYVDGVQFEQSATAAGTPTSYSEPRTIDIFIRADRVNLATNPNFNLSTTNPIRSLLDNFSTNFQSVFNGSPSTPIVLDNTISKYGTTSGKLVAPNSGPGTSYANIGGVFSLKPNVTYTWSIYVYAPVDTWIQPYYYGLSEEGDNYRTVGRINGSTSTSDIIQIYRGWNRLSGTGTTPGDWFGNTSVIVGCARDQLNLQNATTIPLNFAAVLVEQGSVVNDYFDGNFSSTDYLWENGAFDTTVGSRSHLYLERRAKQYRINDIVGQHVPHGLPYNIVYAANPDTTSIGGVNTPANPLDPTVSSPPQNLTASSGEQGQSTLSWTAPASTGNSPITGYTVIISPTPATTLPSINTNNTNLVVTGLTNSTAYTFYVVAVNGVGKSSPSNSVIATPGTTISAPATAPTLTAVSGSASIGLSWTSVTGATAYQVFRNGTNVYSGSALTFTDTGLTNGTAYSYQISASNASGYGPLSSATSATPGYSVQTLFYDFTGTDGAALDSSKLIKSTAFTNTLPTGASILGNAGRFITNTIGNYDINDRVVYSVNLAPSTDQEVLVDMTLTAGEVYPGVQLRSDVDANATGYAFELTSNGLELTRILSYTRVSEATSTAVLPAVGTTYRCRFKVAGSAVTGRVWVAGTTEPTSWQISFTDPAPLTAGVVALYLAPGNTAVTSSTQGVSFDNLNVTSGTATTTGGGGTPAVTGQVFASSSFWYDNISTAPLASNSSSIAADAVRQMKQYYGSSTRTNVGLNTTSYAAPVYLAAPGDPTVNFGFNDCQSKGYFDSGLRSQFQNVPIPTNAQPADGTDSEMVVWSKSADKMWEFWVTVHSGSSWSACWGGRMDNVSTSNGIWQGGYGTTATGLPFLGGQISMDEMTAAMAGSANAIPHAIGIAFVETKAGHSWPAQRDDGGYGSSPIMEGMRLRIDPALNVAALNLNPIAKAITLAGQKYGFVVWDKAGAVTIRCENPKSRTVNGQANPYPGWFSAAGVQDYNALDGVPWSHLQALPVNYGQR